LPSQVSGGEQERVAIARAIVNRPPILLADEPTWNLDSRTGKEVMGLIDGLNSEGITIIMVTHNPEYARYADRVLRISDGVLDGNGRH
jgi:ABC-type lipoprotein export system ATPase subunit